MSDVGDEGVYPVVNINHETDKLTHYERARLESLSQAIHTPVRAPEELAITEVLKRADIYYQWVRHNTGFLTHAEETLTNMGEVLKQAYLRILEGEGVPGEEEWINDTITDIIGAGLVVRQQAHLE